MPRVCRRIKPREVISDDQDEEFLTALVSKFVNIDVQNFRTFVITNFIPLFGTSVNVSDESGRDHLAGESASPRSFAVSLITLSSVKLCISLRDVGSFLALWNETVLHAFKVSPASLTESKLPSLLCFLPLFMFYCWYSISY